MTTTADTMTLMTVHSQVRFDYRTDFEAVRILKLAARWHGPDDYDVDLDEVGQPRGRRAVQLLADGQDVSVDRLDGARAWLDAAAEYFRTTEPPLAAFAADWKVAAEDCRLAGRLLETLAAEAIESIPRVISVSDRWDDRP